MMGRDKPPQRSLFYTGINLDKRVRDDHVLRKVSRLVDFDFVYGEVEKSYGYNGNVSVAPPLIVRILMFSTRGHPKRTNCVSFARSIQIFTVSFPVPRMPYR